MHTFILMIVLMYVCSPQEYCCVNITAICMNCRMNQRMQQKYRHQPVAIVPVYFVNRVKCKTVSFQLIVLFDELIHNCLILVFKIRNLMNSRCVYENMTRTQKKEWAQLRERFPVCHWPSDTAAPGALWCAESDDEDRVAKCHLRRVPRLWRQKTAARPVLIPDWPVIKVSGLSLV